MEFEPNAFYTIMDQNSELNLAVSGGSRANGAKLIQWPAEGNDAQVFLLQGGEDDFRILTLTTLQALSVCDGSTEPGALIVQWSPNSSANQRFLLRTADNYLVITSRPTGLVLAIADGSVTEGTNVIQWEFNGKPDQMFSMEDAGAGFVRFRNKKSNMLLAIAGGSVEPGAQLIQWPDDGSDAQCFLCVGDPEDGYMILPKATVKLLGIQDGSVAPGAPVVQWFPSGAPDQQFGLKDAGSGFATIMSRPSGLVLGILGGSVLQGEKVVQWNDTGAPDQRLWLTQVSRAIRQLDADDLRPGSPLLEAMLRFCPELRLHPLERYFPDGIENLLGLSQVRDAQDVTVLNQPEDTDLQQFGLWGSWPDHVVKDAYYLSLPGDWESPHLYGQTPIGRIPIGTGQYRGGFKDGQITVPMAARGYTVNGTYWFDYLFCYPYNGNQVMQVKYFSLTRQGLPFLRTGYLTVDPMATHIGDWEHAQVQVDGDLKKVLAIRVFGHGDPDVISRGNPEWKQLTWTDGDHVVLYAGLHSHATYATTGPKLQWVHWAAEYILPLVSGLYQLRTCDWCADGGASWKGWLNLVPFGADASGRALPGFPGGLWPDFYPHRWGRSRVFDGDTTVTVGRVGPGVRWVHAEQAAELEEALHLAILAKASPELLDGLGVSPPDWWRHGY